MSAVATVQGPALSLNRRLTSNFDLETALRACDKLASKLPSDQTMPLKEKWVLWEQLTVHKTYQTPSSPTPPLGEEAEGEAGKQDLREVAVSAAKGISNYGELTKKVAEIATVQEFWKYFNFLPQPSVVIGENRKIVRYELLETGELSKQPTHTLGALMLFLEGVRPEWEDEANQKGGHFQFTMQMAGFKSRSTTDFGEAGATPTQNNAGQGLIDEIWNNLVLAIVGNTLEPANFVTGLRLVDKMKSAGGKGGASTRNNATGHLRVEVWFREMDDDKIQLLKASMETAMRQRLDLTAAVSEGTEVSIFPGYRLDLRPHDETAMQQNVQESINSRKQYKRTRCRNQILSSARSRGELN